MTDLPTLTGPALPPASGGKPRQLVIFLHGVGADGNDLIGLAPLFQQILPDALFVSPHAPFPFDMAPQGRQWFSLGDFSLQSRLAGTRQAAPILEAFMKTLMSSHDLTEAQTALIGFSQGTMMALHVGLRRHNRLAGIIGYSGMLTGADVLKDEIKSRPPVLLTHGDADPVLPVDSLPAAVAGLKAAGVEVESQVRPGLGHSIDDECIRLGKDFMGRIFGLPVAAK